MATVAVTMEKSSGARLTVYLDSGDMNASVVGTQKVVTWGGVAQVLTFAKSFRWRLTRALDSGETFTQTDPLALTRVVGYGVGQSNEEGRANRTKAPAVVNASKLSPNTYPYDENLSGPGGDSCGGPMILLMDAILSRGTYDRGTIISTATGNQTIANLYGTTGDDGSYATQRNDSGVCGGKETNNPPPIMLPGDKYFIVYVQGEGDASSGAPADWSADVTALLDHIRTSDFPSSTCIGILVARFSPNAPDNGDPSTSHPDWQVIRAEQLSLDNPSGTPPVTVVDLENNDRITGDLVHIDMGDNPSDRTRGWPRWCDAAITAMVADGWPI